MPPQTLAPTEVQTKLNADLARLRELHDNPRSKISEATRAKLKKVLYDENLLQRPTQPIETEHVFPLGSALKEYGQQPIEWDVEHPFRSAFKAGTTLAAQQLAPIGTGIDLMALPIRTLGRPAVEQISGNYPQLSFGEKMQRSLQEDRDVGNVWMRREVADANTTYQRNLERGMTPQQAAADVQGRINKAFMLGGTIENAMSLADPIVAMRALRKPASIAESMSAFDLPATRTAAEAIPTPATTPAPTPAPVPEPAFQFKPWPEIGQKPAPVPEPAFQFKPWPEIGQPAAPVAPKVEAPAVPNVPTAKPKSQLNPGVLERLQAMEAAGAKGPSGRPIPNYPNDVFEQKSQNIFDLIPDEGIPNGPAAAIFKADDAFYTGKPVEAANLLEQAAKQFPDEVDQQAAQSIVEELGWLKNAEKNVVDPDWLEAHKLGRKVEPKKIEAELQAIADSKDPTALEDLSKILRTKAGMAIHDPKVIAEADAAMERWATVHGPRILQGAKEAGMDVVSYLKANYPGIPPEHIALFAKRLSEPVGQAASQAGAKAAPEVPITTKEGRGQYAGKANVSVYSNPDVAAEVMNTIDANPSIVEGLHLTHTDIQKIADDIAAGDRTAGIVDQIMKRGPGQFAGEVSLEGRRAAATVEAFLESGLGQDATEMKAAVDKIIKNAIARRAKVLSETGRALHAGGLPVEAQQQLKQRMEEILQKYKGNRDVTAAVKQLQDAVLSPEFRPSIWDKLYYIWINGLLSGPKTMGINFLGNATHVLKKLVDKPFEVGVDMALSLKTGQRSVTMDELPKMIKAALSGEKLPAKFAHVRTKAMDELSQVSPLQDKITKNLEPLMYGQRVLGATDKFFGNLVAKMEHAALKGKGLSDLQMQELIADEAKLRTFTRDPSSLAKVLLYAKSKLQGARWFLPFIRTATDIIGQAVEYTPAGLVNVARKSKTQREAAQRIARVVQGTLVGVWAYDQWKKGNLTGDAPKDAKGRNHFLQVQKKQENSIRVGDKWLPLNNFEPVGSMISAFTNFFEGKDKARQDAKSLAEQFAAGTAMAGVALMNKRYLAGVVNLMNIASSPETRGPAAVTQIASGFIPGSVKAVTDQMDTTKRASSELSSKFTRRVPGMSKTLTPALDVFGREQQKPSTFNMLNIMSGEQAPEDRVIQDTPLSMPPMKINGQQLTDEEYYELSKDAGEMKKAALLKMKAKLEGMGGERKQYVVDYINRTANEAAKMRFMQKNPKYRPTFPFLE